MPIYLEMVNEEVQKKSEGKIEVVFNGADHALTKQIHQKNKSSHFNSSFGKLINSSQYQQKDMLTT